MDYRTAILGLIPAILFLVFIIVLPIIGYFSGYKRALYWSIGNMVFIGISWAVWATQGENIANSIISLFGFDGQANDYLPIILSIGGSIWYFIFIIGGNLILLILWYSLFKWLLRLTRKQKYKYYKDKKTLKDEQSFVKRHQIVSRCFGTGIMFLSFLPISATVTETMYAYTTSTEQRSENAFVRGMHDFAHGVSSINYYKYFSDPSADVDALFAMLNDGMVEVTTDIFTTCFDSFQEILNVFETTQYDDPSITYEDIISDLQDRLTQTSDSPPAIEWSMLSGPHEHELATLFKSKPMTETLVNVIGSQFNTNGADRNAFEITQEAMDNIDMFIENANAYPNSGVETMSDIIEDIFLKNETPIYNPTVEIASKNYDYFIDSIFKTAFTFDYDLDISKQKEFENYYKEMMSYFFTPLIK